MVSDRDLVDTLLTDPGAALLDSLETECRIDLACDDLQPTRNPPPSAPRSPSSTPLTFGELVQRATAAADRIAGPWMPDAP